MKYAVTLDFTNCADELAEIERGNPVRNYYFDAAYRCGQLINAVRMARGLSMVPRSCKPGYTYDLGRGATAKVELAED